MSFEAPLMLLGLLAIGPVLWIHLSQRREAKVEFPAVSLLSRVARRRAPRLKIRTVLLLLLRILAVASLILATARPGLKVRRPGGIRSGLALAQVIVLDDSLSMRRKVDDGAVFDRAVELAVAELDRLRPGDASMLVLSGYPARSATGEISFDLSPASKALDALEPGFRSADIGGALRIAARALEESPLPQREVVVITDLCEDGWGGRPLPWPAEAGVGFRVISASPDAPERNLSVDQVSVRPLGDGATREAVVEAKVSNHGDSVVEAAEIVLEVDGTEAARGSMDLPPRGFAVKRFHHRFAKEGVHRGLVRISPDALPQDDLRHFTIIVRKSMKVLVIDGDYRPGSYRDEVFYLHKALQTPSPGEVPIESSVVDLETARAGHLVGNDAVFVAGVGQIPGGLASRIEQYVSAGGGLFVSPGKEGKLAGIEDVLPARIRSVRVSRRGLPPYRIGAVNRVHPIFGLFGEGPTGLEDVRVNAHLLVEPDPSLERGVVADLKGGVPLLLERKVGKGKVLLLTTTVDRDWTDLPIRPGFLPLVQRAARYLAGSLGDRDPRRVFVGRAVDLEVSEGMQRLIVLDPEGNETVFPSRELVGEPRVRFGATAVPGPYRVWAEVPGFGGLKELPQLEFVVETDPAESDLTPIAAPLDSDVAAPLEGIEGTLPAWPYLLVAAAFLILIESLLSGLWLRRSHTTR